MECSTASKLINLCKTHWVAGLDALEFFDLYSAVITLEVISQGSSNGWNSKLADSLLNTIFNIIHFQFLMAFIVANKIHKGPHSITIKVSQIYLSCLPTVFVEVHESMWFDGAVTLGRKANVCEPDIVTDKLEGTTL